jgi:2,5-furandicarboxylate decarboxylase 1
MRQDLTAPSSDTSLAGPGPAGWPETQNLRSWLDLLDTRGELGRVETAIDPDGALATVLRHADGRRALRFADVQGSPFPAVGNLVGGRDHLGLAMGCRADATAAHFLSAVEAPRPCRLVEAAAAPVLGQEAGGDLLSRLPIGRQHERDAGRYITAALLSVRDRRTGLTNLSVNRMQVISDTEIRVCVLANRLADVIADAERADRALDVAIVLGVDPLLVLASQAPPDNGLDDLEVASALRASPLPVVRAPHIDALVPAEAEILIEGRFRPNVRADEGPFGEFPLTYAETAPGPVVDVVGAWHRPSPIFQTILSAGREHFLVGGVPREAELLRGLQRCRVDVAQVRLTEASACRLHAVVSLRNARPGAARNAIISALGVNPSLKSVLIVDEDVDVFDDEHVGWAFTTRVQADRDLMVLPGVRGSTNDPSATDGITAKLGIDATAPRDQRSAYERIRNIALDEGVLAQYLQEAGLGARGGGASGRAGIPCRHA